MTAARNDSHGAELRRARDRAFDALLEEQFADAPPMAAIVDRAAHRPTPGALRSARTWLAAALALLGVSVAIALAWQQRAGNDRRAMSPQDHESQDPHPTAITPDGEVRWPTNAARVDDVFGLPTLPNGTRHLHLELPLHYAKDLSRLESLQHLAVELSPRMVAGLVRAATEPRIKGRLDTLTTTPNLSSLSLESLAVAAEDFAALQHVPNLQSLSLGSLWRPDDDKAEFRPFDGEFGAAVAKWNPAPALRLRNMPLTAEGVAALAKTNLRALTIDGPSDTPPSALLPIGDCKQLQHLVLRWLHSDTARPPAAGPPLTFGSRALSATLMRRIAALPKLRSLTLDGCFLDRALIDNLPRGLQVLDLSRCFGVDGHLAEVIEEMSELRELGLPLTATGGSKLASMWRPPIPDEIAAQRLSPEEAHAIIGNRVWQALRLDGQLTQRVTDALSAQTELRQLTITPTSNSESLAFVAQLPRLERVTLLQTEVSGALLLPLNGCASLQTVVFHDCTIAMPPSHPGDQEDVLRDGIAVRWSFRGSQRL